MPAFQHQLQQLEWFGCVHDCLIVNVRPSGIPELERGDGGDEWIDSMMDLPRREVCGDEETALITQVRAVSGAGACRSVRLIHLCVNFKEIYL